MKIDMTLLEKDSAPTIAELKAFFRDHDFSTQMSKYDPITAPEEQNRVYIKAKKYFLSSWNKQMKLFTGKGSLINFTSNAHVRLSFFSLLILGTRKRVCVFLETYLVRGIIVLNLIPDVFRYHFLVSSNCIYVIASAPEMS